MNHQAKNARTLAENTKSLLDLKYPHNTFVFLLDKRAHIVWCSEQSTVPAHSLLDALPVSETATVESAVSRCLLRGETAEYTTIGERTATMPEGNPVTWRVRLFPYNHEFSTIAAVGVCSLLPDNYSSFTQDDRDLIGYLAADMSLKEIAHRLNRSESALDSRIKLLKDKLNVNTLAGLVGSAMINHIR